jgi:iron(III) transport system substrate-binding protein
MLNVRVLSLLIAAACAPMLQAAEEVNIYSARQEALIKPLLDRFTAHSGIQVNLVTGNADALLTRLEQEGRNTQADVFVTTDAGRLWRAQQAGVLQAIESEVLTAAIPPQYREDSGYWFGLTLRARPILYSIERVKPEELSTYEDLTDPKWKKRVCVRSSDNIYNQSHLASMIATKGAEETEAWARALVANFARPPQGGDRDQIKAVAAGQCDLALVNTYYYGGMLVEGDEAERKAIATTALFWPNQQDRGVHVNISGAGVTAAAKNRDNAIRLLEFMLSDEAQTWYAEVNYEYPIKADMPVSDTLKAWGEFKPDTLNLDLLGIHNPEAVRIADRAGWK